MNPRRLLPMALLAAVLGLSPAQAAGELEFPVIEGWPNGGSGRVNLDGSRGACSACHTRHRFSIGMARKPHTCRECHIGPDVPAYKVYAASKHANIYSAMGREWDFRAVPWTVGTDFTAPTCAACHVSLLTDPDGAVAAERTHEMKNRLSWRIFGLIYAHPQPKSPDTTIIRNKNGHPLPTDLDGGTASDFLISEEEQATRTAAMQAVCLKCHDRSWVDGHFRRYRKAIETTNVSIRTATAALQTAWEEGLAQGIAQRARAPLTSLWNGGGATHGSFTATTSVSRRPWRAAGIMGFSPMGGTTSPPP